MGPSTMLPLLPDDVISKILSWVPVKPACRFQCVSRGWRKLISSPAILAMHKSRADPLLISGTTSILPKSGSVWRLMDIEGNIVRVIEKAGFWRINKCVDGPICVYASDFYVGVIDLATGNKVRTSAELSHPYMYINLSVGCAVPSGTYKVVCPCQCDPWKVLTLEDGAKWRQLQSPPTPSLVTKGYHRGSPITVNGVMHFLYKPLRPQVEEEHVLCIDIESEEWKAAIKGPTRCGDELRENIFLVKLNDALCMVQWSSTNVCLLCVLADSAKGTWVKVYTIPMAATVDSLRPLAVLNDGRKLLFYARVRLEETPTLQVYDPLTGTCTHLTQFASNLLGNSGLCVLHLESFVSPKSLPISAPSVLSQLISCQWLRRLNPVSLFYK